MIINQTELINDALDRVVNHAEAQATARGRRLRLALFELIELETCYIKVLRSEVYEPRRGMRGNGGR